MIKVIVSGTNIKIIYNSVNHVVINLNDPCASIETPDVMVPHVILRVQMYKAAINAIVKQPLKFTDDMDCAICHKKNIHLLTVLF